jgi:hypothetical protein
LKKTSRKSRAKTSKTVSPSTPSLGLAAGLSPCDLPAGTQLDLFGLAPVPASPSPLPAKAKGKKMKGISGRSFSDLSGHDALSRSLASKLKLRLESVGSIEYRQTWRRKATPSGLLYWAHTASARRTSGSESTGSQPDGWGTPTSHERTLEPRDVDHGAQLANQALLAGWPTCAATDGTKGASDHHDKNLTLSGAAILAVPSGWSPPAARDGKDAGDAFEKNPGIVDVASRLPRQVMLLGWSTPRESDTGRQRTKEALARAREKGGSVSLEDQVQALAGGLTPVVQNDRGLQTNPEKALQRRRQGHQLNLDDQVQLTNGPTSFSSLAATTRSGVLDPSFSLWLQGFLIDPATSAWNTCSPGWSSWVTVQRMLDDFYAMREGIASGG